MCHCRPGITRGRSQDRHRLVTADGGQHLRHKAPTEVFKRQRRAMKQLQATNIALNRLYGCRESKRIRTRASRISCGISSPMNAPRILALRVTKSWSAFRRFLSG
jgi:hypothetical protein